MYQESARSNAVRILLEYGADPQITNSKDSHVTALMIAAENTDYESVLHLLKAGADPNVEDINGKTALEYVPDMKKFMTFLVIRDHLKN